MDSALAAQGNTDLQGKIAIANAKVAYGRFGELFANDRWAKLSAQGAVPQRLLWASTSTKNPEYPDTLYMDALIGPQTVNTVPPATLTAFMDHGTAASTLADGIDNAQNAVARLASLGVDLDAITQKLQDEGVAGFSKSFESLMTSLAEKSDKLQSGWQGMDASLNGYTGVVNAALDQIRDTEVMKRIWRHDHTVWRADPAEITNRLGWLHMPEVMPENVARIMGLVDAVRADGYTHALLLGMGGSSLAPEVFYKVYGQPASATNTYLELGIVDSTDPDMLRARAAGLDLAKTLFIVATKSGGTAETLSAFKHFYNETMAKVGAANVGQHFIAITDPASKLVDIANTYDFRATFLNDPNIGGRYSALSYFGLVPAGLVGVDLSKLLDRAQTMACNAESSNCPVGGDNAGARLGAIIGVLAQQGRDKVTIVASPTIASIGDWVEQLIAESTGKDGKGILPVVGEPAGAPNSYGSDRLFVYVRLDGDTTHDGAIEALRQAGQPVVTLTLQDRYDLGGQFFLWEMATVVAGMIIDIQPFDQPNVEAAKIVARQMVAEYMAKGELPIGESAPVTGDALQQFLAQAAAGDYISVHAYIAPTVGTDAALAVLRTRLRDKLKLATTVGYGPRFLHSTGQLHKGDGGNGLFIQFTSDPVADVPIPDEAGKTASTMSFGVLKNAQALGDAQALRDANRRLIRFHLGTDVVDGLNKLAGAV